MNVLVTGGAGFVGSHLCDALLRDGHNVTALDNLSTGSLSNLRNAAGHPRFRFIRGDIRDGEELEQAVQAAGAPSSSERLIPSSDSSKDCPARPDIVFHLAAAVGVRTILEHPLNSLETNLSGTENVLRAVSRWGGKAIIASTSEVYGKNEGGPLSEDADRIVGSGDLARWWYAVAKMADEGLALAYHREHRLQAIVVRLFNTVGPRQTGRYGMVLPTLVRQALRGESLTVFGDGEQTRCFTYVEDTVRALIGLATTARAFGQIFNIGQPQEISINALAERILRLTGSTSRITHIPYSDAYGDSFEDMRRRVPDCSLLLRTIGFAPSNRLDEAIRAVTLDLREHGAARAEA